MKETLIVLTAILLGGGILFVILDLRKNGVSGPTLTGKSGTVYNSSAVVCSDAPASYAGPCIDDNGSLTNSTAFTLGVLPSGQGPALPSGYSPSKAPQAAAQILDPGITPWVNDPANYCPACVS